MAQTTSGSILGMIRRESWILDHFEFFVTIALKGHKGIAGKAKMVTPPGEQHCLGGGICGL